MIYLMNWSNLRDCQLPNRTIRRLVMWFMQSYSSNYTRRGDYFHRCYFVCPLLSRVT